ncbi:hypothetical protein T440DRAFT_525653 [Plenodomus tracheiphilus IPT5]|uniref:Uncharacterized protein n=1 Tax=Plenodomus tracheiphilus IPT5 TaxID=1408161 RepID=A0A6A7AQ31_9PLEO|nr:hypothetical protein T440DRAFT_525653 [Plenodomus tracheiphilus IPT5]
MAPYIFYRVEDEHSRARYIDGQGIFAEGTDTRLDFRRPRITLGPRLNDISIGATETPRHLFPFIL